MKPTERFFILAAEYKMLANRIKFSHEHGMEWEHPQMKAMCETFGGLSDALEKEIGEYLPKLIEKVPDAQEQLYAELKIKQV
jgi:hypothetical protein